MDDVILVTRINDHVVSSSSRGGGTEGEVAVYNCRLVVSELEQQNKEAFPDSGMSPPMAIWKAISV